ncbi:PAS domain-containing protein [Gemmatimonas groenlandica]|uniref:PAS domain-containing protein n=1 Tax=Gemmatimonas groenlandica TaxID=2732249 RepID=A0A6M4IVT5_9BACT|nr:PAS domain-containing protein [Gemmatimonas groenlandica]QJR37717.1 PAS domain-containing protein [Gemmatimonas groenlandica]
MLVTSSDLPQNIADARLGQMALVAIDQVSAMIAYWDANEVCQFANGAYLDWFGKTREEMVGLTLRELLGPIYLLNEAYIRAAYAGERQQFERRIPMPDGSGHRDSIATYAPYIQDGIVSGMFVHVADSGLLKAKERELERVIAERDAAAAKVRTLEGLLPISSSCKCIRTSEGAWTQVEQFVASRTNAEFTHGICPTCVTRLYPEFA